MGTSILKSKVNFAYYYNKDDWNVVSVSHENSSFQILRHKKTNQQVQMYLIGAKEYRDFQREMNIYYQRYKAGIAIVQTISVEKIIEKSNFAFQYHPIRVLISRIPLRFYQFCQLTFGEILYVLCQSIRGFRFLIKKAGYFDITDRMIGIDQFGKIKVWFNSNFARNQPQFRKQALKGLKCQDNQQNLVDLQGKFMRVLFKIIEQKCQQGHYPADFRQKIYANNMNFNEAFVFAQNYAKEKKTWVPRALSKDTEYIVYKQRKFLFETALNGISSKKQTCLSESKDKIKGKVAFQIDESIAIETEDFFQFKLQNQFKAKDNKSLKAVQRAKIYYLENQIVKQFTQTNIASQKQTNSQLSICSYINFY